MRLIDLKYLILTPALVWVGVPMIISADTDFGQLAITGDISPQERLAKKIELTRNALVMAVEKAEAMKTSLEKLEFGEKSVEEQLRNQYLDEVSKYITFYQERGVTLDTADSLEETDTLIQTIIEYREGIYAPSAKNVLEFILVFSYSPSVLDTAKERYESIKADVERLAGLNLIEVEQFTGTIEQSRMTLEDAEKLQAQARELILEPYRATSTTSEVLTVPAGTEITEATPAESAESVIDNNQKVGEIIEPTPTVIVLNARELAEESLNKIKGLYDIFIETGQKIKEALGIQ